MARKTSEIPSHEFEDILQITDLIVHKISAEHAGSRREYNV